MGSGRIFTGKRDIRHDELSAEFVGSVARGMVKDKFISTFSTFICVNTMYRWSVFTIFTRSTNFSLFFDVMFLFYEMFLREKKEDNNTFMNSNTPTI
mmetsp:Transcript_19522/g.30003  ORF Transcript_19522/g.30003 Transcript_19522/m.30003 type:complete len:97 (-) Transcript_19522:50-340(-)